MNLIVTESDYEMWPHIVDVNLLLLRAYKKSLVVCSREGQKFRLNKSREEGLHTAQIKGWWDLSGETVNSLEDYDAVFIIDPYRIGEEKVKEQWLRLIKQWG